MDTQERLLPLQYREDTLLFMKEVYPYTILLPIECEVRYSTANQFLFHKFSIIRFPEKDQIVYLFQKYSDMEIFIERFAIGLKREWIGTRTLKLIRRNDG